MSGHIISTASDRPPLTIRIDGSATETGTRDILQQVTQWLTHNNQPGDIISTVELVLAEAINNIVEHAYAETAERSVRKKPLWADLTLTSQQLHVTLSDAGVPFPDETLPNGNLPDLNVALDDLPEGGFGWFLIFSQTQSVRYHREAGKNSLSLGFKCGTE
ncbi:ATP-binding protein [Roseovarius sp. EL26]|uniref:ATP-binding protein n=1 Tax=Roseovarius sp. EL26 TaxID=2126672 RepID=UPI0020B16950|nr:ATP-binding protein [Roseovarius sp. EL26]